MKEARPRSRRGAVSTAVVTAGMASWALLFSSSPAVVRANDMLNEVVEDAFVFAGVQLRTMAEDVLVELGVFTDYTDTDGAWITEKSNGNTIDQTVWTSGMVAGMFWYQYEATGEAYWKTKAEFFLEGLEGVELLDDNDTGFQVFNAFGLGYKLSSDETVKEAYKERVLTGAATLHDFRWADNIPAFWSWSSPTLRPDWLRAVNVDMMMNMEILLWASVNGGPTTYAADVEGHADTTWEHIVRDDNSTFHVADFDIDTGELNDQGTYQGYSDSSTWTRGQAWAIYGYVMLYRFLEEPRFLEMSLGLLLYWEGRLEGELVPPADFDAPVDATLNGKDSSASAIVASACFDLLLATEDVSYLIDAQSYLFALLEEDYYIPDATDGYQSILRRASARWGDPEVGAVFGDYFLLEAMVRYKKLAPSILLFGESDVEVPAADGTDTAEVNAFNLADDDWSDSIIYLDDDTSYTIRRLSEAGPRRLQQELTGGTFCALKVSGGTVEFADPDCVPKPPNFDALDSASTPAPSVAAMGGAGGTEAPSVAPSAFETGTASPSSSPTAGPPTVAMGSTSTAPMVNQLSGASQAPSSSAGSGTVTGSMVFGAGELDNDVDLSYLDPTRPIVIRFALELDNTYNVPSLLVVESAGGDVLETPIPPPAGGWTQGANKVVFTLPVGVFGGTTWSNVASVSVFFEEGVSVAFTGVTLATVTWLVISNELIL